MASTSQTENGRNLPKWGILGAGAMGWLWTYYLQRAKIDTLLLQRQNTSSRECIIQKDKIFENCRTSAMKSDNPFLPTLEALLVATKAYSVRSALLPLQETLIKKQIPIVLLQNGLGVFEEVRKLFPEQPILILSTSNGAYWHESAFLKLTQKLINGYSSRCRESGFGVDFSSNFGGNLRCRYHSLFVLGNVQVGFI